MLTEDEVKRAMEEWRTEKDRLYNLRDEHFFVTLPNIQKQCPHTKTVYIPDASGNNDSSTECVLCGKELR